jgi:pimeloyl-ACP methyl ester carboxylesterase
VRTHLRSATVVAVSSSFTPSHRGGSGTPLVCVHGFMDTWRTWELVLPALERRHDVLAPTLPGHAGGPSIAGTSADAGAAVDALERAMDGAGFATAHIVGNSLGGYLALQLAARGRAESVVALSPAGGWADGNASFLEILDLQRKLHETARELAPHADTIMETDSGRRRATLYTTENYRHIPAELLAHQLRGVACESISTLIDAARYERWPLDAERITCPVRIVWGAEDQLLGWPSAAERFRTALPHAEWVVLDAVGHSPQLDIPLESAQLILGFTDR